MYDIFRNRDVRSNKDDCKIMKWSMDGLKLSFFTQQGRSHGASLEAGRQPREDGQVSHD